MIPGLLRLGRFQRVLGPGINWTFPGFDRLIATVDMRIRSTPFAAEKTLTKDTVPVKERGALMVVPTGMVSSMGGLIGMASAAFDGPHRRTSEEPDADPAA